MKLAVISTHDNGRADFIKNFQKKWPMYKTPSPSYKDKIGDIKLKLNRKGDKKSQKIILDALVDELQEAIMNNEYFVLFTNGIVENIAYSLWLNSNGKGKVDDEFIMDSRVIVNQMVKHYDIIFYMPLRDEIKLNKTATKENLGFRQEIDYIIDAMVNTYEKNKGIYFPLVDCPAVIRLEGPPDLRAEQIRMYIKESGKCFAEEDGSLIATP